MDTEKDQKSHREQFASSILIVAPKGTLRVLFAPFWVELKGESGGSPQWFVVETVKWNCDGELEYVIEGECLRFQFFLLLV